MSLRLAVFKVLACIYLQVVRRQRTWADEPILMALRGRTEWTVITEWLLGTPEGYKKAYPKSAPSCQSEKSPKSKALNCWCSLPPVWSQGVLDRPGFRSLGAWMSNRLRGYMNPARYLWVREYERVSVDERNQLCFKMKSASLLTLDDFKVCCVAATVLIT